MTPDEVVSEEEILKVLQDSSDEHILNNFPKQFVFGDRHKIAHAIHTLITGKMKGEGRWE